MTDNQIKLMQLRNYQAMPLGAKVRRTENLIREWYEAHDGLVYVAFSGGKDSTVLLDIVWSLYPDVPAVFADTGNELESVREFVNGYGERVTWVKPKMTFDEVVAKHGYPVVSKEQSGFIHELRQTGSEKLARIRWFGNKWGRGKISEKWKYLLNAPFKITHKCCGILKIDPTKVYRKETKRKTMTGVMAQESALREQTFVRFGCNAFDLSDPTSRPIIFWNESDVLDYITSKEIPISGAYGEVRNGRCTKLQRTGCKFCLFGIDHERGENRIQRLAREEPESYRHAIEDLHYDKVMDALGVDWKPYNPDIQQDLFDPSYDIDASLIKENHGN